LPLVLLAAAAHPDRAVRERIARRLDWAIEEGQPLHSEAEVRGLFCRRTAARRFPGVYLEPAVVETVVRVLRLVFRRGRPKIAKWRVRILSHEVLCGEESADDRDLVITHQLKLFDPERLGQGERRRQQIRGRRRARCQVVTGLLGRRLRHLQEEKKIVRARCRIDHGFCLSVTGELPWSHCHGLERRSTLDGDRILSLLGFSFTFQEGTLQVRAATPEATIAFSAALARGGRVFLRGTEPGANQVSVVLHDFEEDEAEFPAVVTSHDPEPWLHGLPPCPVTVAEEDRLEIARRLYLPGCWRTDALLEQLLTCRETAWCTSAPNRTGPGRPTFGSALVPPAGT
jgi:hypothetical protein